ncbi:MAG: hypothetical protein P8Y95_03460 [Gammaproteobacteria bacterium]
MDTAQRVFKEAQEQRRSDSEDPWAEGENESESESDWIVSGGGSEGGESEGEPGGGGQVGNAEGQPGGQPRDLEGEFEKSLEDYDGKIMDERAIIIASANNRAGDRELPKPPAGAAGTDGEGGDGAPGSAGGLPGGARASGASDIPTTLPPKNTTPGDYDPVQVARIPADIPPGDDDDVVARQLREAAMAEEDPVLREKLWD